MSDEFSPRVKKNLSKIKVVPCGVRAHFNSLIKNSMRFMANCRVYTVKLHKEAHKTSIFGAEWAKFFSDNHLGGWRDGLFRHEHAHARGLHCFHDRQRV